MGDKQAAVQAYLDKFNVRDRLEDALNKCVKATPDDPFAFIAGILNDLSSSEASVAKIVGREILDSRGNPTVEVDVYANINGTVKFIARGNAPSGASTGSNEAHELRDGDDRYMKKGTTKAVENVSSMLSGAVAGKSPIDQAAIDDALCKADGTELKQNAGGNAITAASFALAEAGAVLADRELFQHFAAAFHGKDNMPKTFKLPTPMVNIINGGKHGGGDLMLQEFMILPKSDLSFKEKLRTVTEVYHNLKKLLTEKYGSSATNLGDEGGFAPPIKNAEEALECLEEAAKRAKYEVGKDIFLAMDCAASEFYDKEKGYEAVKGEWMTSDALVDYYVKLVEAHPAIVSIEDAMDEKDYAGWKKFTEKLGSKIMVVGDDLYTTNTRFIKQGIEEKWANALLLKVNQIGTVSEAMEAAKLLFKEDQKVIVSHRSGETTGAVIADLVVGIGATHIKTGAPARGERVAKYNRLLQIEEFLNAHNMLG